jgi:quinol monooxygenase YgiN
MKDEPMITVWGSIEAASDRLEEALKLSLEHVHRSRLEPGCISHSVQVDAENGCRLVFFEEWADMAALQAHFNVPASAEFLQQVSALASSPPQMKIFESTQIN